MFGFSSISTMVDELAAAGASADQIAIAVRHLESSIKNALEPIESRRANDRERKRRSRDNPRKSREVTVTPSPTPSPSPETKENPPHPLKKNSTLSPSPSPSPLFKSDDLNVNEKIVDALPIEKIDEKKREVRQQLAEFGAKWNVLAGQFSLPQIDEIKPGSVRERQALARLREAPDCVPALMARIRGSPYLRGEVNGFRCSFDWIVKPSNFQKIIEGNYEDRKVVSIRR